jgi:hypothetical protein
MRCVRENRQGVTQNPTDYLSDQEQDRDDHHNHKFLDRDCVFMAVFVLSERTGDIKRIAIERNGISGWFLLVQERLA